MDGHLVVLLSNRRTQTYLGWCFFWAEAEETRQAGDRKPLSLDPCIRTKALPPTNAGRLIWRFLKSAKPVRWIKLLFGHPKLLERQNFKVQSQTQSGQSKKTPDEWMNEWLIERCLRVTFYRRLKNQHKTDKGPVLKKLLFYGRGKL